MKNLLTLLFLLTATALPAGASSLPPADFGGRGQVGLGAGMGVGLIPAAGLSLDMPVWENLSLGGSVSSTFRSGATVDVRALYRFIEGSRETPAVVGILGLWGAVGGPSPDPRFTFQVPIAPAIGFGLAYSPLNKMMLRLNLAYSPFYVYGNELLYFIGGHPSSGVEIAYEIRPGLSITGGINGNGDLLGVAYRF